MACLVLSNGMVFEGEPAGDFRETVGELVFTTGMNGYLETLTDPSYAGQLVIQTFPMIGNYGLIPEDFEGEPALKGYIVRHLCDTPSNFRSKGQLSGWLRERHIPALVGPDTRALTRILRESGTMNAMLCETCPPDLQALRDYSVKGQVMACTCREIRTYAPEDPVRFRVALMDYGAKRNIIRELLKRGCEVTQLPADTPAEAVLEMHPQGLMLSNGPGDPAENVYQVEQLRRLMGRLPIFGICLGHQLAALAMGGRTLRLKYGHRGVNQPVVDLRSGRTYITSQNHGYAVDARSLEGRGTEIFRNANDGSCEGMLYDQCMTVQFHPEACAGPMDTGFLFDTFMTMMGGGSLA